ncbi:MAG TPA: hypothetical protein PLA91_05575 [Bacillota bacterium]|nr:hypothetical protein [Bacillota bacterium]
MYTFKCTLFVRSRLTTGANGVLDDSSGTRSFLENGETRARAISGCAGCCEGTRSG